MKKLLLTLLFALPLLAMGADLETIGWGVVKVKSATALDKEGKATGKIYGGELFTVYREITVNQEPAYYVQPNQKKSKPCILRGEDCRVFMEVPPAKDDTEAYSTYRMKRLLISDYYGNLLARDTLVEQALERHTKDSPAKELPKLKEELAQIPEKDRTYEQRQKKATKNAERLKYQDLRKELRYRATGLQNEIARLEPLAEKWNAEHPFDDSALQKSGAYVRLTKQIDNLRERLEALGVTFEP